MSMHQVWRLQHFLRVAQAGSFHAGAALLNVSQPALTKSIRLLEQSLGTELFLRLPRGVRLTEAGEVLYRRAVEIEETWNAALVEVNGQRQGMGGVLRIGGGPVYSAVHFPGMLAELRERYPRLAVTVAHGVGRELLPSLRSGAISAYAGGLPRESDELGPDFTCVELYRQVNGLFASHDHPLLIGGAPAPSDALDYPWLSLLGGHHAISKIGAYFAALDLPAPELALESPSVQIAFRMIRDHKFIACMPAPLADAFPETNLKPLDFANFRWSVPTGLTFRRASHDFPPLVTMISSLRRITEPLRLAGEQPDGAA